MMRAGGSSAERGVPMAMGMCHPPGLRRERNGEGMGGDGAEQDPPVSQ